MAVEVMKYRGETLRVTCPWCGALVRATALTDGFERDNGVYVLVECPGDCPPFLAIDYYGRYDPLEDTYPPPQVEASQLHKAIPEAVRDDYAEALRCSHSRAFKATVVLCRRVVQAVAVDKGAQGGKLGEQIESMRQKGLITASLHHAATEVRHFGNFGAHPRDDGLDEVTWDDAQAVIKLTFAFLEDLYIRPQQTARLMQKRTQSPSPSD